MTENWKKNITIEDLPENFRFVAELCGIDIAVNLLENLPGIPIYVPNNGFKKLKDQFIKRDFDGSMDSIIRLALRYEVTCQYVRNILKETDGQIKLF